MATDAQHITPRRPPEHETLIWLFDVRPDFSPDDSADCNLRDRHRVGDAPLGLSPSCTFPDVPHHVFGDLALTVTLSPSHDGAISSQCSKCDTDAAAVMAVLCDHIGHVVPVRTGEQVIRPDARRVVALVEHVEAIRNASEVQDVRQAMGVDSLSVERGNRISLSVRCPAPSPATIGLGHLRPECGDGLLSGMAIGSSTLDPALRRAETLRVGSIRGGENRSADGTNSFRATIVVHREASLLGVTPPTDLAIGAGVLRVNYTTPYLVGVR
jgi:hypothetical protein